MKISRKQAEWRVANRDVSNAIHARYRKNNPEKAAESQIKYRAANAERVKANAAASRRRVRAKERTLRAAENPIPAECDSCGYAPNGKRGQAILHWDHDHRTGKFRGWLCGSCNTALGLLKDDGFRILNLNAYLIRSTTQ